MTQLKDCSIRIKGSIQVRYPEEETMLLDVTEIAKNNTGKYCVNNGILCFVENDEVVYVTAATPSSLTTLDNEGYEQAYFYVPFSNRDYPLYEKYKWERILECSREARHARFVVKCINFCNKRNIRCISEVVLNHCLRIPKEGIAVRGGLSGGVSYVYPQLAGDIFNDEVKKKIGHYCCNNGVVVFIASDGDTYVARGFWIIEKLCSAGYTLGSLPVPFSNGEEILNEDIRALWAKTRKADFWGY